MVKKVLNSVVKFGENLIKSVEQMPMDFPRWALLLFSVVFLRNFFESTFAKPQYVGFDIDFRVSIDSLFMTFFPFYLCAVLVIIVFLHYLIKEKIEKLARAVIIGAFLTVSVPIVDLIFNPKGHVIFYPFNMEQVKVIFMALFNPFVEFPWGYFAGFRFQLVVGALIVIAYVYLKTRSVWKAIIGGYLGGVSLLLILVSIPVIIGGILGIPYDYDPQLGKGIFFQQGGLIPAPRREAPIFIILGFLLSILCYVRLKNQGLKQLLSHICLTDVLKIFVLLNFGFFTGFLLFSSTFPYTFKNPLDILIFPCFLVIAFSSVTGLFSFSKAIQERSKTDLWVGVAAISFSLFASFAMGNAFFLIFIAFLILEFIRLIPPLSLSRFPVISSIIVAFNSLLLIWAGFSLFGLGKSPFIIPIYATSLVLFLVFFFEEGMRWKDKFKSFALLLFAVGFISIPFILNLQNLILYSLAGIGVVAFLLFKKRLSQLLYILLLLFSLATIFLKPSQPQEGWGYLLKGNYLYSMLDYKGALEAYMLALDYGEKDNLPWLNMGMAALNVKNPEIAVNAFKKAVEQAYPMDKPYMLLGDAYLLRNDTSEAIKCWDTTYILYNTNLEILYLLGIRFFSVYRFDKALHCLSLAARMGKEKAECYRVMGDIKVTQKNPLEAEELYKKGLEDDPNHIPLYESLTNLYNAQGREKEIFDVLRRAIKAGPKMPEELTELGFLLYKYGMLDEAIVQFKNAISYNPKFPLPLYYLGLIYETKGMLREAYVMYRRAFESNPAYKEAIIGMQRIEKKVFGR